MSNLPGILRLSPHAKQRLEERKDPDTYYDTKNLMRSTCKWYGKDDLIPDSNLYVHCLYVCRKARNKMGYITNGHVEVLYDKNTDTAITVMEVKEKFLPITQYIKGATLKRDEIRKENRKMRKTKIGTCPDCGENDVEITSQGICARCRLRKTNAKTNGKEYIPYINLPEEAKQKINHMRNAQAIVSHKNKVNDLMAPIADIAPEYISPDNINPDRPEPSETPEKDIRIDPLIDNASFISVLKECGCDIPEQALKETLDVLLATNKIKDLFITIAKNSNQKALLDLEQMLNVAERKLQHTWEFNGFQEIDDIKFKGFLTWRRVLKGAIFFWKKLYQTNTLVELQRAWNAYTQDPNEKVVMVCDEARTNSILKRFQITTETISTIFNTRRQFTRVFYASSEDDAREKLTKWLGDRQLHENKAKTVIVELTADKDSEEVKEDDR